MTPYLGSAERTLAELELPPEMAASLIDDIQKYIANPEEEYRKRIILPASQGIDIPTDYTQWVGTVRSPHTETEIEHRALQALGYDLLFVGHDANIEQHGMYLDTYATQDDLSTRLLPLGSLMCETTISGLVDRATSGCMSSEELDIDGHTLSAKDGLSTERMLSLLQRSFMLSTLISLRDYPLDEPDQVQQCLEDVYTYQVLRRAGKTPLDMEELVGLVMRQVRQILRANPELSPL